MLSFIAAAVPIAGSLYVAGSMLYEYTHAAHVARAYARIQERFRPEYDALDMKVLGGAEYDRQTKAISARRRTLLEQNGLDPTLGTAAAFNRMQKPAAPGALTCAVSGRCSSRPPSGWCW